MQTSNWSVKVQITAQLRKSAAGRKELPPQHILFHRPNEKIFENVDPDMFNYD
jgi:hypothetical protein